MPGSYPEETLTVAPAGTVARPALDPALPDAVLPSAVLWDMDGTLVDTEPYWIATEFELAELHGGTWSQEHALNLVGGDLMDSARYIQRHMGVDLPAEQIVDFLLDGVIRRVREEIPWRPGARELLTALDAAGIPCALVTMSYARLVAPVLEQLAPGTFAAVVTGDRVSHGKPHPEPYLVAAAELGVEPGACLAIEDSHTGATSAAEAGCGVLCVPHHVPVPAGKRRVFAESLVGLEVPALAEILQAADR